MRVELVLVPGQEGAPHHRLVFEMPGVPQIGDRVTISRPGQSGNTDFVVSRACWALEHPCTGSHHAGECAVGTTASVTVECEFVAGPYSSEEHKTVPVGGAT